MSVSNTLNPSIHSSSSSISSTSDPAEKETQNATTDNPSDESNTKQNDEIKSLINLLNNFEIEGELDKYKNPKKPTTVGGMDGESHSGDDSNVSEDAPLTAKNNDKTVDKKQNTSSSGSSFIKYRTNSWISSSESTEDSVDNDVDNVLRVDDANDDDDDDIYAPFNDAGKILADFAKRVNELPPDIKQKVDFKAVYAATAAAAKEIARNMNDRRVEEKDLGNVMKELDMTARVATFLEINSASQGTNSQKIQEVLDVVGENQHIFEKCHIPSQENKEKINDNIEKTKKLISDTDGGKIPAVGEIKSFFSYTLSNQLIMLEELLTEQNDYESPFLPRKTAEECKLHSDSACEIFKSLVDNANDIKGYDEKKKAALRQDAAALVKLFEQRSEAFQTVIATKSLPIEALQRHPSDTSSSELLKKIEGKYGKQLRRLTEMDPSSDKTWIEEIIDTFLEKYPKADTRSGRRLLAAGKSFVLDQMRDWAVVESEFLIPVRADKEVESSRSDGTKQLNSVTPVSSAKIRTVMTPVGHVFNQPTVSIDGRWQQIAQRATQDYQIKDPNDPKKHITTGRNSHATTEHLHGVNVSRTEVRAADKTLFSATKHATLSGYELYTDSIKQMSNQKLDRMARDLIALSKVRQTSTNPFDDNDSVNVAPQSMTQLDIAWATAMKALGADKEPADPDAISEASVKAFIKKASKDKDFCALLRRRVAVNRAREVLLSEAVGNPAMRARIENGEPVHFTSISLITPDPLRNFLAKLLPSKFRRHDELSMRKEELQAWKDLQEEIDQGECKINGEVMHAKIHTFSAGVNQLALDSTNPLTRALCSGWDMAEEGNRKNLTELIGDPAKCLHQKIFGGQVGEMLLELQKESLSEHTDEDRRDEIANLIEQIEVLATQIAELWESGDYQRAGDQPYKFASRIAMLSNLLQGGTAFSCKSGKDRTAQLELEAKLLAVQCEFRSHEYPWVKTADGVIKHVIPPPYTGRTNFDKYQLMSMVFKDKSRTAAQRYNTGVEGSKLKYWRELYASFIPADENVDTIGRLFRGKSMEVRS